VPSITITSSAPEAADHYSNHDGLDIVLPAMEAVPEPPPRSSLEQDHDAEAQAVLALFAESDASEDEDEGRAGYLDIGPTDNLVDLVLEGIESKLDKAQVLDGKRGQCSWIAVRVLAHCVMLMFLQRSLCKCSRRGASTRAGLPTPTRPRTAITTSLLVRHESSLLARACL